MSRLANTAETKAHILDAARREFASKGYAGASINAIVDATHFSKPTVYYHFKNKASLFATLIEEAYHQFILNRTTAIDPEGSAADQIRQAIEADFASCLGSPDLVQFALAVIFSMPDEHPVDLRETLEQDHLFYRGIVERGMERGELACSDAAEAAMVLQGAITLNVMSYLKMGHPAEFLSPERARAIANTLLSGFRAGTPSTQPAADTAGAATLESPHE